MGPGGPILGGRADRPVRQAPRRPLISAVGMEAAAKPRRRRRTPEVAEREIVAAAQQFLRERPFRELTVDEVMRRTDLSRPSFYVYFRDRHQLLLRVVEDIGADLFRQSDLWFKGHDDPLKELRDALEGVAAVF